MRERDKSGLVISDSFLTYSVHSSQIHLSALV